VSTSTLGPLQVAALMELRSARLSAGVRALSPRRPTTQPNWTHYWHAVRASAAMPGLEFYELKHRAIQRMIDPASDGGLGLDPQTTAKMVGHNDGGWLISTVYTKLSEHRARDRAQHAMNAYQRRTHGPGQQRQSRRP